MKKFISRLLGAWGDPQPLKTVARDTSGVIIGASDGESLIDAGTDPVAVLGPCRSGKGTTIIVPTLLTWRESAIVIDVHGELYGITEHWRRTGAGNDVRRLAFGDPSSPDTFNFLDAIPRGTTSELADIQALASVLLDDGRNDDNYWRNHAQSLLAMFIIASRPSLVASLHDVQQAVSDDVAFGATIATYRDAIPDNELGHAAKAAAIAFGELPDKARAAVRMMVVSSLSIFASPEVARNTMRSSFDLAELRDSKAATTLYLSFAAHDLFRLQPLIRAFLAQVVRHGTRERHQAESSRLLLVLDEFTALGRLSFLEGSLAYLPGYGIKPLLAIQSLTQLNSVYGNENNLWAQCVIRTVLPVRDFETAAAVADDIARTNQRQRPITADELMRLGKREAIILGAAEKPIRANVLPYYEDARFKSRVQARDSALSTATADAVAHS